MEPTIYCEFNFFFFFALEKRFPWLRRRYHSRNLIIWQWGRSKYPKRRRVNCSRSLWRCFSISLVILRINVALAIFQSTNLWNRSGEIGNRTQCYHTVKSTVRSMAKRLFTWYFRFQNIWIRNKFVWVSRWISGFYITKSCKECHWTPFYPPNTLMGREYHFQVVRMFLRSFSHKQYAESSIHRAIHPAVTKMITVSFAVNVLQHNLNKQF